MEVGDDFFGYKIELYKTQHGDFYLPDGPDDDDVIRDMKSGVVFDQWVVKRVKNFCEKGKSIIDVGAHFGQMTVLFSKMACQVYSCECFPPYADVLKANINKNGCENVDVIEKVVYSSCGEKINYIMPPQSPDIEGEYRCFGSYGVDPTLEDSDYQLETITLDSLGIEDVGFIKIDAQGCDLEVIKGAVGLIEKHKPFIIFEYEEMLQDKFSVCFEDYEKFIDKIGYEIVEQDKCNYLLTPRI